MNILITGGAGFIGSHLADRLLQENHKVTVVDDLSNGRLENLAPHENLKFIKLDVSNPFWPENNFKVIYHLACFPRSKSWSDPYRDTQVNLLGMINVLEIAKKTHAKVIFSSNSGIYDTSKIPINEEAKDTPKTPYDLNKLTSEKYLELYDLDYTIFRFATVYGPRQRTSPDWKPVIIEFIEKLSQGISPTIYWDGKQTRDFIEVSDIVNALTIAKDVEARGPIILGTGRETSIRELYQTVSNHLGVDIEPKQGPKAQGDIRRMRYDCAKAKKLLGWNPETSLNQGISKIIKSAKVPNHATQI